MTQSTNLSLNITITNLFSLVVIGSWNSDCDLFYFSSLFVEISQYRTDTCRMLVAIIFLLVAAQKHKLCYIYSLF